MGIFDKRLNYKPFVYGHITDPLINAMWASHWTHNEFNFISDVQDFKSRLTEEERQVVKRTTLLISSIEVTVKSYWSNLGKLLPQPEIADLGAVFGGVEVIHSRAYSQILSKLGFEDDFKTLFENPFVKGRSEYLTKYVNKIYKSDRKNIVYSLILFTLFTEYCALFSQFYVILGFNRFQGVMKDIANIVQYTAKEENLHAEGGIAIINQIRLEYPELFDDELEAKVYEEVQEAFNAEANLAEWLLQGYSNSFLSEDILKGYIKIRLNDSLEKVGYNKVFDVEEGILEKTQWMEEEVYMSALTDFFVKKPTDYAKKTQSITDEDLF
jgi:ribonucleoside-diphosphate reductase beta chain